MSQEEHLKDLQMADGALTQDRVTTATVLFIVGMRRETLSARLFFG